jgi:hypothetical protein
MNHQYDKSSKSSGVGGPASRPAALLELAAADPQDRVGGQGGTNKRRQGNDSSDDVTLDNAPPVVVRTSPNFKDRDRRPAVPYLLVFETKH